MNQVSLRHIVLGTEIWVATKNAAVILRTQLAFVFTLTYTLPTVTATGLSCIDSFHI
jgi:hypothetical protein